MKNDELMKTSYRLTNADLFRLHPYPFLAKKTNPRTADKKPHGDLEMLKTAEISDGGRVPSRWHDSDWCRDPSDNRAVRDAYRRASSANER